MGPKSIEDSAEIPCHPAGGRRPSWTHPDHLRTFHCQSRQAPACWLSRVQREGVAQRAYLGIGCNVEKSTSQAEVLEERPKVLIPGITVERKAPEIVEQDRGHDHIEYEKQRCLPPIKPREDANRTDDLQNAAEHQ